MTEEINEIGAAAEPLVVRLRWRIAVARESAGKGNWAATALNFDEQDALVDVVEATAIYHVLRRTPAASAAQRGACFEAITEALTRLTQTAPTTPPTTKTGISDAS